MSYKVENLNGCTKKFKFQFEKLDLSKEIGAALKEKQKSVNIKGFRIGKAPLSMVEQMYRGQIESDALNRFVQKELFAAIDKEKVRIVGYPSFENVKYESGNKVEFDAMVEIFPEFEFASMGKYSFKKDKVEIDEKEVETTVKNYLNSKAEMVELENATLQKGMFAVFDFEGVTESGERPDNMKAKDYSLEIGSGQFIPGFEDGMIGLKKGDKKNISVTFPENYHVNELKNAKVTFEVELHAVKEKKYPELTDEMAKEFGYESVQNMRDSNRESLLEQKNRSAQEKLQQQILEKLVEDNKFDVPTIMIAQQEEHVKEDVKRSLKYQGYSDDMVEEYFKKWADDLTKKAEFQVRSGLILDKLSRELKIETSDADLEEKIEETAKRTRLDKEKVRSYYFSDDNMKKNMMYAIREEKTFKKLIEEKITVK